MQPLVESTFLVLEGVLGGLAPAMVEADLHEAGDLYEEFVEAMRAHGILYLLIDAKPEKFFHDLIVSAFAWRHYLNRCTRAGYSDFHSALSRSDAFIDALAAGHLPLALELVELGPKEWMKGDEYEEDFWWRWFLGIFARDGNSRAGELDRILERFEAALDGVPSGRLEVCRALRAQDEEAFEVAFAELVVEWERDCADLAGRAEEEPIVAAGTQIFVEGLAVLRLAEGVGISAPGPFHGCPPLANRPRRQPPIEDPFNS